MNPEKCLIESKKQEDSKKQIENTNACPSSIIKNNISEWNELLALYTDIESYSDKTIYLYMIEYRKEMKDNYKKACDLFHDSSKISTLFASYQKDIKINLMKVFVLTAQENMFEFLQIFSENPNEAAINSAIKESFDLHNYLFSITQENEIFQYDKTIFRVISDNIRLILQKVKEKNYKDATLIPNYFHSLFFSFRILLDFYLKRPEDNKDGLNESFEFLLEILDASINYKVFLVSILGQESWVKGKKNHLLKSIFCEERLSLIAITQEDPVFTLRQVVLFNFLRFYKLTANKKICMIKDEVLSKIITEIIKMNIVYESLEGISTKDIEAMLNQNIILLKLLKRFLLNSKEPLQDLEKPHLKENIKRLICKNLIVALTFDLVIKISPDKMQDLHYRTSNDYISFIFKFLDNLGLKKDKAIPTLFPFVCEIIQEILIEMPNEIKDIKRYNISILKYYLVELVSLISDMDMVQNLINGKLVNYIAPRSLVLSAYNSEEDIFEEAVAAVIISWLNNLHKINKTWSIALFKLLIKDAEKDEIEKEQIFGIYRLFYCAAISNVVDFKTFHSIIFSTNTNEFYKGNYPIKANALEILFEIDAINSLFKKLNADQAKKGPYSDELAISMTENFIVYLHNIPEISVKLLNNPENVIKWLELIVKKPRILGFVLKLLTKLFSSESIIPEFKTKEEEESKYLPLMIIIFLNEKLEKNEDNFQILIYPIFELLFQYISLKKNSPTFAAHQKILTIKPRVKILISILQKNKDKNSLGKCFLSFLKYLNGIQFQNPETREMCSKQISGSTIKSFIEGLVTQDDISEEIVKEIQKSLWETSFDKPHGQPNTRQNVIINEAFMEILCLFLSVLATKEKYERQISDLINQLDKAIEDSYLNCIVLSKRRIFHYLVKLMKRFKNKPKISIKIINILKKTAKINISNRSLKEFIGLLKNFPCETEDNFENVNIILNSLNEMITQKNEEELFIIGEKSGLRIEQQKFLPKEGYCFLGWVRLENFLQVETSKRTIYNFQSMPNKITIELFIGKENLHYSITDLKNKDHSFIIHFPEFSFKNEIFYFIEFYHLNTDSMNNIQLFINGEKISERKGRYYPIQKDFDNNLIGCDYDTEKTSPINCFCGEISTLYFINVNSRNIAFTHTFIENLYGSINMSEFIDLAAGYTHKSANVSQKNMNEFSLIERIICVANPKWANRKKPKYKKIMTKMGLNKIDINNDIEFIFPQTYLNHNNTARKVFANIEGFKSLLPLLYKLGEINENPSMNYFVYPHIKLNYYRCSTVSNILTIFRNSIIIEPQRMEVFLKKEDGFLVVRYLLEKVFNFYLIYKLAKGSGLTNNVYTQLSDILEIVAHYTPALTEKYIENVLLNPEIWKTGSDKAQEDILIFSTSLHRDFGSFVKIETIVNMLLHSIEIICNNQKDPMQILHKITKIVLEVTESKLTKGVLITFLPYLNILYIRQYPTYPLQLFLVLQILLKMFQSCITITI